MNGSRTTRRDLSGLAWTLCGWTPWAWRLRITTETGFALPPAVGPVPMRLPGSVQQALFDAKLIPDWNVSTHTREIEWIENRHWTLDAELPLDWCRASGEKHLCCDMLDHAGFVFVGDDEAGTFDNGFTDHRFDLGRHIDAFLCGHPQATSVPLRIVFTCPPRWLGQIGYTSQIRDWKARFNYGWDWTPRLVQIGVADRVWLETRPRVALHACGVWTEYTHANGRAAVRARFTVQGYTGEARVRIELFDEDRPLARVERPATQDADFTLEAGPVEPWWPADLGPQRRYRVRVVLVAGDDSVLDERERLVGFREVRWVACEGAPTDAEPWRLQVNGRDLFVLGVNWVPLRPNYADVATSEYARQIAQYRDHGFNLLRVWGGAPIERDAFYDACDAAGVMVWQEFPFSSSGLDNWPPESQSVIDDARDIARSYIRRRQHHPSLIMWCGGNELQWGKDDSRTGGGVPIGYEHPLLRALRDEVGGLDPTRRFVPTSPYGPRFNVTRGEVGKGVHHLIHGPWDIPGSFEQWEEYWQHDDALFRSEVGVPGASSTQIIRRYCLDEGIPADQTHPGWLHASSWWLQWALFCRVVCDTRDLETYVQWSQSRQTRGLITAIKACYDRFPRCGGFIVWMGHDCFPCPCNTSLFDFEGNPKPVALAIRAWRASMSSEAATPGKKVSP